MNPSVIAEIYRHPGRSTRAIVDLNAIATNVSVVRRHVGPGVGIMAVVKANGYGHGAISVGRRAIDAGAEQLAVATVDEAVQLRVAGIQAPIVILGPIDDSEIGLALVHCVELAVGSLAFAQAIAREAAQLEITSPVPLHVKLDSGMHRFGATIDETVEIAKFIDSTQSLRLRAVFTHLARADEIGDEPTNAQIALLEEVIDRLGVMGIRPEMTHVANSAGILRSRCFHRAFVRLGVALYGLNPSPEVTIATGMRPAMTLVSRVARVFDLRPGDRVNYGGTYVAQAAHKAALVPIGYADGYDRGLSNQFEMYVRGRRCPILGRICMDQTVIGLPAESDVEVGEPAIVAGAWDGGGPPTIDEIACQIGTINYEVAARIAARVPRFFVKDGHVVAVSDLQGHRTIESIPLNSK